MPEKKQHHEQESHEAEHHGPRPFWSGTITFGLVSLPVSLFVATRSKRVALRMIDHEGEPLARRYFCPKEKTALEPEEIVRGYEIEKNKFVLVDEEELDSIAPVKSQEIDLRRFVPVDGIDPMFFQRAYFLAPSQGAIKPYRLMAKSMEETERAGIATCVIRGKEYLLAILSYKGILRAEILRFADELRTPADIGLPKIKKAKNKTVSQMVKSINANSRKTLDRDELLDERAARILGIVDEKLEADEDVIHDPEDIEDEGKEDESVPVDLMAVLKQSLQQKAHSSGQRGEKKSSGKSKRAAGSKKKRNGRKKDTGTRDDMTRDELYTKARDLDIVGRSRMTKSELAAATKGT
ncbi:non-homologous end joining protein Ku [Salinisphaera aquimarina]|uniref:Ku protein n=1 Tax=Salinisphaera aquimarina TaxID=2094031 RepID=A0ABV7ES14_9GAMM